MQSLVALIGRICLSVIFVMSAVGKIFNWPEMIGYARMHFDAHGIELPAGGIHVAVAFAAVLALVGGVLLVIGLKARLAAVLLLLFLLPVTYVMHGFWVFPTAAEAAELRAPAVQIDEEAPANGEDAIIEDEADEPEAADDEPAANDDQPGANPDAAEAEEAYEGPIREEEQVQFFKNLALIGGLLMVLAFGGGRAGIDGMLARRRSHEHEGA